MSLSDWEYPAASDRGGVPADTENYIILLGEIQDAFAQTNPGWEVTITLPFSYWHLQNFDLPGL
jgi:chitinase